MGRSRPGVYIALTNTEALALVKQTKPIPVLQINDLKDLIFEVGYSRFSALEFMIPPTPELLHDAF